MDGFRGFIIFIIAISWIVRAVSKASKSAQGTNDQKRAEAYKREEAMKRFDEKKREFERIRAEQVRKGADPEKSAKLAQLELMRKQRQEMLIAQGRLNTPGTEHSKSSEKPVLDHSTDDCGGGSIHDGYHEGTVKRPAPAASAEGVWGKQGVSGMEGGMWQADKTGAGAYAAQTDDNYASNPAAARNAGSVNSCSGAEKLANVIADKPAIVQGLIWSEVLSRPLSDS